MPNTRLLNRSRTAIAGALLVVLVQCVIVSSDAGALVSNGPSAALSSDDVTERSADVAESPEVPVSWSVAPGPHAAEPSRPNFVLEAAPGEVITDSFVVTNHGEVTLVLGITANDAFNTPEGGMDLLATSETPRGLGSWVELEQSSVTVAPGESVTVPFEVSVPTDVEPGDHSGGIVSTLTVDQPDSEGNQVRYERRLGTRIHIRVDGALVPSLSFTEMSATYRTNPNPFAPGTMTVRYSVANTGNVRVRSTQRLVVDGGVGAIREVPLADMAELLPGNSYSFEHDVGGVWPFFGTRTQVVVEPYSVSDGPTGTTLPAVVARSEQSLVPVPQIVLLMVIAALVATALSWRTRSRSRFRDAVEQAVEEAMATSPGSRGDSGPHPVSD